MSHDRKLELLNNNKVIYRRHPISDQPTEEYDWGWYYEQGTHECYELFRSKAKITTYKSLKWHLLVIWYLNPDFDESKFRHVAKTICDIKNGFVTFKVSDNLFESIFKDLKQCDLEHPPRNKLRKIIFKDFSGLSISEKLSIVGKLIGRSSIVNEEKIYDAMLAINSTNNKITIKNLASHFACSTRTIHRHMSSVLKKEKKILNEEI